MERIDYDQGKRIHKLSAIDVLPPEDYRRGYVAEFFDADGFVGLYVRNDRPTPIICFTNTHVHVFELVAYLGIST